MLYFVENLTRRIWRQSVLPQLQQGLNDGVPHSLLYFEATAPGLRAATNDAGRVRDITIDRFTFKLIDVRDEAGVLLRLRVHFSDLQEVENDLLKDFPLARNSEEERLPAFVLKEATKFSILGKQAVSRALMLVQICAWSMRQKNAKRAVLFLSARPWFSSIERYAARNGIALIAVQPPRTVPGNPPELYARLQQGFPRVFFWLQALRSVSQLRLPVTTSSMATQRIDPAPKIAVEYKGYFNVNRPECYSDVFFWQSSNLPGTAMLMTFALPQDPLNQERSRQLAKHGIRATALHPGASKAPGVPLFVYRPSITQSWTTRSDRNAGNARESDWIKKQTALYHLHRDYWTQLFREENVKLYVSWYRYDGTHCAIGDAVRSLGGINAIYQRAFQADSTPDTRIHTDVAFGYSAFDASVERRSGSIIEYHVSTGYLGDHRFSLLGPQAEDLKMRLKQRGARFIIAFFDEFAGPDERWNTGEALQRDNYAFLLEKVLDDPELGLVLKPKVPMSLRRRLGPVAAQLDRALESGRCYCYDEGTIQGVYPPAAAALAADIAIHGHACTATAGFEAALAGKPTAMLDLEGWHTSPIYDLGPDVIFQSRQDLWAAVVDYRKDPKKYRKFGNWSPMLERLDPFRDGRGAYRMGEYLNWLLKDLTAGRDRITAMADAAERYTRAYGTDKITAVNTGTARFVSRESVEV